MRKKPVVLCILDGFGWREDATNNAVAQANMPCFRELWRTQPHCLLRTDGEAVGLPRGQMGNSEVGHQTIGGGRVFWQDLPRIDAAIADGTLKNHPALQSIIRDLKGTKKVCHLIGLLSPGGIHSHQNQTAALATILATAGVNVTIHGFLDGRDRPPTASTEDLPAFAAQIGTGLPVQLATLCGRYYAMDRDNRWERIERAYNMLVDGDGDRFADLTMGILTHHALKITDEFMEPLVNATYGGMQDGDALICTNFRADRARQILAALTLPEFDKFTRNRVVTFSHVLGMTDYGGDTQHTVRPLFPPIEAVETFAEVISRHGLKQLRLAETEKFPHVTYFFNGGRELPWPGEDRITVPSPKVATYDLQPEMSAHDVTAKLVNAINSSAYDVIVVNYANGDMVGHTGILPAAIKAAETLDECLDKVVTAVRNAGGLLMVTADHGNCEEMWDTQTNGPHTQHSLNPVPCIVMGAGDSALRDGTLADIAPTLLQHLQLPQPAEMTGKSLVK